MTTFIMIIGLIASIIGIISVATWDVEKKLKALIQGLILIVIFFIGFFFNDFSSNKYNEEIIEKFSINLTPIDNVKTFLIDNHELKFTPITSANFLLQFKKEEEILNELKGKAKREGDKLVITTSTKEEIILTNVYDDDSIEGIRYEIGQYYKQENILVINVFIHEGASSIMINLKSGYKQEICSDIYVSPSSKYMISTVGGIDMFPTYNCWLVKYKSFGTSFKEEWEFRDWEHQEKLIENGMYGFGSVIWISDNSAVIQVFVDEIDNNNRYTFPCLLEM